MDLTDGLLIIGIGILVYGLIIRPMRHIKPTQVDPDPVTSDSAVVDAGSDDIPQPANVTPAPATSDDVLNIRLSAAKQSQAPVSSSPQSSSFAEPVVVQTIDLPPLSPTHASSVTDDLADFQLSSDDESDVTGMSLPETGRWVPPDETIQLAGLTVSGGYVYYGESLASLDQQGTEAALIDPTLPVNWHVPDVAGELVGYWPSYDDIDPRSRAAYLAWLATNRSASDTYIGYVFLYFYGLERRLLLDDQTNPIPATERAALLIELARLQAIYGHNRSFNNYVMNLMTHVQVLQYVGDTDQSDYKIPSLDILCTGRNFNAAFQYALGVTVQAGEPIPAVLALAWVKSHPDVNLRTPARRCAALFDCLFQLRFHDHFAEGLIVKPNKTRLKLSYRPASASLRGYQSVTLDVPNACYLKLPVKKLMVLAEACTAELEAYSRFVGVKDHAPDTLAAVSRLPDDLAQQVVCQDLTRLQAWVQAQLADADWCSVAVADVLAQCCTGQPTKLNKATAEFVANVLQKAGVGMAPDRRYHHASPALDGQMILFVGGHGPDFGTSAMYQQMAARLRLGAMVACIDQAVHQAEVTMLHTLVTEQVGFSTIERRSLLAYLHWRLQAPSSTAGLKTLFATINQREKQFVSDLLLRVALSDGVIVPSEVKQLEKLYCSLGLDPAMVRHDLDVLLVEQPAEPDAEVSITEPSAPVSHFRLDADRLSQLTQETQEVQATLAAIFAEDDSAEPIETPDEVAEPMGHLTRQLDKRHHALYQLLVVESVWTWDALRRQCETLGLMPEGALEVINDWAFDQVDAPLIETGDHCSIDQDIVAEIAALSS